MAAVVALVRWNEEELLEPPGWIRAGMPERRVCKTCKTVRLEHKLCATCYREVP